MRGDEQEDGLGAMSFIKVRLEGEGRIFNRTSEMRGVFENGQLNGKGYYRCKIKENEPYEYIGEFKNGKKEGKGIEKYKLVHYDGDFVNDKKTGAGVLTLEISNVYKREREDEENKIAIQDKERDPAEMVMKTKDFIKARQEF